MFEAGLQVRGGDLDAANETLERGLAAVDDDKDSSEEQFRLVCLNRVPEDDDLHEDLDAPDFDPTTSRMADWE